MIANTFAIIVALIHCYIFVLESLLWNKPKTAKIFGLTPELALANQKFAFNQGFYNLFLSIAIGVGFFIPEGKILIDYACFSVLGAALVLYFSGSKMRPALIQGMPALLYLVFRFFITT
jgi:putative membrane protein